MSLSLVLTTKNEEKDLPICIESVGNIVTEIIIVDNNSTDKTLEVAEKYKAKIFQRSFDNYKNQKEYALKQASKEWVLHLDPDEQLTPELKDEIKNIIAAPCGFDAFDIFYINYFLGKEMKHGGLGKEKHIRLFKRGKAHFGGGLVHEGIVIDGKIGVLKNKIIHNSYPTLKEYFEKFNRYTTLAAAQMYKDGKRFKFSKVFSIPFEFHKRYTMRLGFLDGVRGLIWAAASAFYVFVKYAKLWELEKKR